MKAPLVIVIVILVGILGFLLVYSQQHDMSAPAAQEQAVGSEPAAGGSGSTDGHEAAPADGTPASGAVPVPAAAGDAK